MKQKVYGIDLDGVCFDFANAFREWLNDHLHINIQRHEITSYYWHEGRDDMSEQEFWHEFHKFGQEGHGYRDLEILEGTKETLRRIHESGAKIFYVTNRPEYAKADTLLALEAHDFPQRENLIFAKGKKAPIIREKNIDVFIDDSPSTIAEITADTRADIYCRNYAFNLHLDDSFFTRVDNWNEFIESEVANGRL